MKFGGAQANEGGALFGMLVMVGILAAVLVGYLSVIEIQARRTSRWQSWNLCVPVAEAGLEEAMAHLNQTGGTNLAGSGWTFSAERGAYVKEHTLDEGRYEAAISTNNPPVITSTGRVRVRGTAAEVSRRLTLTTRANSGLRGIVSTTLASVKDFATADSYDSSLTTGP